MFWLWIIGLIPDDLNKIKQLNDATADLICLDLPLPTPAWWEIWDEI
jgi:hypothetical protein